MKCPICCGEGSVPYQLDDDLFDETVCEYCDGEGEIMTNEEWFTSLSTEEKARFLANDAWRFNNQFYYMSREEGWFEWLKQIHK